MELRPTCENCNKQLPNDSNEAMICTYDCTFCKDCVEQVLMNVCPNCGGGFEKRPTRPKEGLPKHPMRETPVFKPVDLEKFRVMLNRYRDIDPRNR
ncbi:MAG: DUF1272 domain-containing protein [Flavobacteriales bacterium]|nr:DUF1272 domain-containing protein [Flavobacteriales bacterium]MCB9447164.1 DUF1272 domain-containing protein [Flavobacteriales bacterium]